MTCPLATLARVSRENLALAEQTAAELGWFLAMPAIWLGQWPSGNFTMRWQLAGETAAIEAARLRAAAENSPDEGPACLGR